jgi:hypothetical protein
LRRRASREGNGKDSAEHKGKSFHEFPPRAVLTAAD